MSPLCEALAALGLTFGLVCQPEESPPVELPADDPAAWAVQPPVPAPVDEPPRAVVAPPFPVVVVHEAPPVAVETPGLKPERVIVMVEAPPDLNPYRRALEAVLRPGAARPGAVAAVEVLPAHAAAFPAVAGAGEQTPVLAPALTQPRYAAAGRVSGLPVDNTRILTADRYISGVLETGFNSQVASEGGGAAIIQTNRDVFGYHGRKVLIPKGSRLICSYEGPERQGETRVAFRCERILIAGHRARFGGAPGRAPGARRVR